MKITLLPNWFKKIGFLLFFIGFLLAGYEGFLDGLSGGATGASKTFSSIFSESTEHLFQILSIFGLVIYMMSKEKVEDDFINKLRLEAFQLTAFIGLIITIITYAISNKIKLPLDYFIILFLWTYLAAFAIKKRIY